MINAVGYQLVSVSFQPCLPREMRISHLVKGLDKVNFVIDQRVYFPHQ